LICTEVFIIGFHSKSLINLKFFRSAFGIGAISPVAPPLAMRLTFTTLLTRARCGQHNTRFCFRVLSGFTCKALSPSDVDARYCCNFWSFLDEIESRHFQRKLNLWPSMG